MTRQLTPNQIKVLRQIYESPGPLVMDQRQRRTLNVLARRGLVTFKYCTGAGSKYYDAIEARRKAPPAKVEQAIAEALNSRKGAKP